ncbi:MAG: hypothetical protein ACFFBD_15710 [Candidatus Hodarchaeota archaeon]
MPDNLNCTLKILEACETHYFLVLDIQVQTIFPNKDLIVKLSTSENLDPPQRKFVKFEPLAPSHLKILWRLKKGSEKTRSILEIDYDTIYMLAS